MQAFQEDLDKFKSRNTQVLGVSSDTLETHDRFTRENGIAFPLISDTKGTVRKLYPGGRVTYLIDREGTIRFIQRGVPDNEKLLEEIDRLGN